MERSNETKKRGERETIPQEIPRKKQNNGFHTVTYSREKSEAGLQIRISELER